MTADKRHDTIGDSLARVWEPLNRSAVPEPGDYDAAFRRLIYAVEETLLWLKDVAKTLERPPARRFLVVVGDDVQGFDSAEQAEEHAAGYGAQSTIIDTQHLRSWAGDND
jgi:hypothetical protein